MIARTVGMLVAASMAIAIAPAQAANTGTFAVMGIVPTVCRADINGDVSMLHQGVNDLGRITELCNDVDGYRLVLDHPTGLQGAYLLLDGQHIAIETDAGETVLVDSDVPAERERNLQLVLADAREHFVPLTIYAEPKGMRF